MLRGAAELERSRSKCVQIGKKWRCPLVGSDGVTIAKEVEIKDAGELLTLRLTDVDNERTELARFGRGLRGLRGRHEQNRLHSLCSYPPRNPRNPRLLQRKP